MTAAAPRYDPRLLAAVELLDRDDHSMAETVRRVAAYADDLGLPRPSYVHMQRFVRFLREEREERRRRADAIRSALADAGVALAAGRIPDAYYLEERMERDLRRGS